MPGIRRCLESGVMEGFTVEGYLSEAYVDVRLKFFLFFLSRCIFSSESFAEFLRM